MYGDAVVQIVDKIALHAIEDLDFPLGCMPRIGERLAHAVVCDGDGGMAPGDGLTDGVGGIGQGIHIGHLRVQVQLHPLLGRCIPASLVRDLHDVKGAELNVLAVAGQLHKALYAQPHTDLDGVLQGGRLFVVHILADGDGIAVVRHIEGQAPQPRPAGFVALRGKDLALQHHAAHLGIQPLHGHGLALDLPAQQHITAAAALAGFVIAAAGKAKLLQFKMRHQQLAQQSLRRLGNYLAGCQLQLHAAVFTVQHTAGNAGIVQQQAQFARRHKALKKFKKRYLLSHSCSLAICLIHTHSCITVL